jgi:hypothetical protein
MIVEGDKSDFFTKIQRFFTLGLNLRVGRGPPGPPSRSATACGPRSSAKNSPMEHDKVVFYGVRCCAASVNCI